MNLTITQVENGYVVEDSRGSIWVAESRGALADLVYELTLKFEVEE